MRLRAEKPPARGAAEGAAKRSKPHEAQHGARRAPHSWGRWCRFRRVRVPIAAHPAPNSMPFAGTNRRALYRTQKNTGPAAGPRVHQVRSGPRAGPSVHRAARTAGTCSRPSVGRFDAGELAAPRGSPARELRARAREASGELAGPCTPGRSRPRGEGFGPCWTLSASPAGDWSAWALAACCGGSIVGRRSKRAPALDVVAHANPDDPGTHDGAHDGRPNRHDDGHPVGALRAVGGQLNCLGGHGFNQKSNAASFALAVSLFVTVIDSSAAVPPRD